MEDFMQNMQIRYDLKSDYTNYDPPLYKKKSNKKRKTEPECEPEINYDDFITEDDEPVDNLFSERQQRLLPDALHSSWEIDKPFLALANVGIYEKNPTTPIIPDVFLSLNVTPAENIWEKKHRCYFISIFGKPPELVVEIISNKVGKERKEKRTRYKNMGVKYYIVYDPGLHVYKTSLHAYQLKGNTYVAFPQKAIRSKQLWFDDIGIGLTIQKGKYQQLMGDWLRWYDSSGNILKTGEEKAKDEERRANAEKKRANDEQKRANDEQKRANDEKKRANDEQKRANAEKKRANAEKKRAKQLEMKMKTEQKRAEAAEKELALLKAQLGLF